MRLSRQEWEERYTGYWKGEVDFAVPMRSQTYLGIGGPADVVVAPGDPMSLKNIVMISQRHETPVRALGSGSNLLVDDSGIDGVVVKLSSFRRIELLRREGDTVELFVEAGAPLQRLVSFCADEGYAGVEGLAGIPGTVGGAICGNAGSFGCEMKDVLQSVVVLDAGGLLDRRAAADLGFRYRGSDVLPTEIVLSANILVRSDEPQTVAERTRAFLEEKRRAQPLAERSAGCVFRNPEGMAAGRLIDEAGCKGMRVGDAEVSSVHANFFINRGKATAAEFRELMEKVADAVERKWGCRLQPEIRIIGTAGMIA